MIREEDCVRSSLGRPQSSDQLDVQERLRKCRIRSWENVALPMLEDNGCSKLPLGIARLPSQIRLRKRASAETGEGIVSSSVWIRSLQVQSESESSEGMLFSDDLAAEKGSPRKAFIVSSQSLTFGTAEAACSFGKLKDINESHLSSSVHSKNGITIRQNNKSGTSSIILSYGAGLVPTAGNKQSTQKMRDSKQGLHCPSLDPREFVIPSPTSYSEKSPLQYLNGFTPTTEDKEKLHFPPFVPRFDELDQTEETRLIRTPDASYNNSSLLRYNLPKACGRLQPRRSSNLIHDRGATGI